MTGLAIGEVWLCNSALEKYRGRTCKILEATSKELYDRIGRPKEAAWVQVLIGEDIHQMSVWMLEPLPLDHKVMTDLGYKSATRIQYAKNEICNFRIVKGQGFRHLATGKVFKYAHEIQRFENLFNN